MSLTSYRAAPPRAGGGTIERRASPAARPSRVVVCGGTRPGGPAATDSPAAWAAVPWALGRFTAEFGTGSGVAAPRWPPGHRVGSSRG
jgi:hypothetical protein